MTTATRRAQLCESMQGAVHAAFQIADFSYARKKNTCHAVAIAIAIAIVLGSVVGGSAGFWLCVPSRHNACFW